MNAPRGGGGVGQMQSIEFRGEGGCWAGEFERILSPVIEAILGQRSYAFRWQMYIFKHFEPAIDFCILRLEPCQSNSNVNVLISIVKHAQIWSCC